MRKVVNISVSEEMYKLIFKRYRAGYHSSVSEYIRSLVRRDAIEHQTPLEQPVEYSPPKPANYYREEFLREMGEGWRD